MARTETPARALLFAVLDGETATLGLRLITGWRHADFLEHVFKVALRRRFVGTGPRDLRGYARQLVTSDQHPDLKLTDDEVARMLRAFLDDTPLTGISKGQMLDVMIAVIRDLVPRQQPELSFIVDTAESRQARLGASPKARSRAVASLRRAGRPAGAGDISPQTGMARYPRSLMTDVPDERVRPDVLRHPDADAILDRIFATFVSRRFPAPTDPSEVEKLVAAVGREFGPEVQFSQPAAVALIRSQLGETAPADGPDRDPDDEIVIKMLVTAGIADDMGLYAVEIDELLRTAEAQPAG